MKKVLVQKESNVIDLSQVTNESIVGIKFKNGKKAFVFEKGDCDFIGVGEKNLNFHNKWSSSSLKEYIQEAASYDAECFVFETTKELYKWLSED